MKLWPPLSKLWPYGCLTSVVGLSAWLLIPEQPPTASPSVASTDRLLSLRKQADTGDNGARMDLAVLLAESPEGKSYLARAAMEGHPPAVVALALGEINSGGAASTQGRLRLEPLARQGHYPAILLLATCLADGHCGPASRADAYMWTLVSRNLAERQKVPDNPLAAYELKLRGLIDSKEAEEASHRAGEIASRIGTVTL